MPVVQSSWVYWIKICLNWIKFGPFYNINGSRYMSMSNKLETVTDNTTLPTYILTSISQTIVCFHITKNILNAFLCIPFSDFVIVWIHRSLLACSFKQFNFMIFFYHDHDLQSIFFFNHMHHFLWTCNT